MSSRNHALPSYSASASIGTWTSSTYASTNVGRTGWLTISPVSAETIGIPDRLSMHQTASLPVPGWSERSTRSSASAAPRPVRSSHAVVSTGVPIGVGLTDRLGTGLSEGIALGVTGADGCGDAGLALGLEPNDGEGLGPVDGAEAAGAPRGEGGPGPGGGPPGGAPPRSGGGGGGAGRPTT